MGGGAKGSKSFKPFTFQLNPNPQGNFLRQIFHVMCSHRSLTPCAPRRTMSEIEVWYCLEWSSVLLDRLRLRYCIACVWEWVCLSEFTTENFRSRPMKRETISNKISNKKLQSVYGMAQSSSRTCRATRILLHPVVHPVVVEGGCFVFYLFQPEQEKVKGWSSAILYHPAGSSATPRECYLRRERRQPKSRN